MWDVYLGSALRSVNSRKCSARDAGEPGAGPAARVAAAAEEKAALSVPGESREAGSSVEVAGNIAFDRQLSAAAAISSS